MILGALAALVVAFGMLIVYDRGYAAAAQKYEATYREAIDKHRAEQARERGAEQARERGQLVLEEIRERVRRQARERAAGKAAW